MSTSNDDKNELMLFQVEEDKNQLALTDEEKLELAIAVREQDELRRFQKASKVADFMQTLKAAKDKLVVDANATEKLILALNQVLGRTYDQASKYSLIGMEQVTLGTDHNLLTSNFYELDNEGLVDKFRAYLCITPTDVLSQDREPLLDQVNQVLTPFKEQNIQVELCIYINSSDYHTYQQTFNELEEHVRPYEDYQVISMLANSHSKSRADIIISAETDITFEMLMSRGLLRAIKHTGDFDKRIYFEPSFIAKIKEISSVDFYLLARREIPNLILSFNNYEGVELKNESLARPTEDFELLAMHAKDHWLTTSTEYKFQSEIIDDFFNCPRLVMIQGLSPIYGMISSQTMWIQGEMFDLDGDESEMVDFEISSESKQYENIKGINDEVVLNQLLAKDYRNLRTNLVQIGNKYLRITELKSKMIIQGVSPAIRTSVKDFEITDYTNVRFLCEYFNKQHYESMSKALRTPDYGLPLRYNLYLARKASRKRNDISNLDTMWFSKRNYHLPQVLELLGEKMELGHIIGDSISGLDGITREEIVVSLEGLKCHI